MSEPMTFGWGATLVLLGLLVLAVAAAWFWWSFPNRGRRRADGFSKADIEESRERLDLLRAARQWGDVSSTDPAYLKRRERH